MDSFFIDIELLMQHNHHYVAYNDEPINHYIFITKQFDVKEHDKKAFPFNFENEERKGLLVVQINSIFSEFSI